MCLVKVREEDDVTVPYRVVRGREFSSAQRTGRYSATIIERTPSKTYIPNSPPRISIPTPQRIEIPTPTRIGIPAPQPAPIFVQPSTPPQIRVPTPSSPISRHSRHSNAHFHDGSPRTSHTSHSSDRRHSRHGSGHRRHRSSSVRRSRSRSNSRNNGTYYHFEEDYTRRYSPRGGYEEEEEEIYVASSPTGSRGSPRYEGFRYVDAPPERRYLRSRSDAGDERPDFLGEPRGSRRSFQRERETSREYVR